MYIYAALHLLHIPYDIGFLAMYNMYHRDTFVI